MDSKSPSAVKASAFQTATHLAHRGLAALLVATVATATAEAAGDAARGEALYRDCQACHSFDKNQIGPMHRGVVGRKAASVPDYAYSAALKASGIVWDPASLDRWLTNPQKLVPGAKMFYSVPDAQSRADIIAFLATQK